MKKHILSMLLIMVMVLGMIPVLASAATTPSIEKVSMTLSGILDVNFKVNANGNDMTGYSVRVTIGSDETSQSITSYTVDGSLYVYTAKLPAHRLPEAMKVELLDADGTAVQTKESWTVATYLEAVKAANADMTALVDALQNYGTYAAYYADPNGTAPAVAAVEAVEQSAMEGSRMELVKTANLGATAALYIDDACDIRVKFDATKMGENKLLVNGKEVTLTADGTKLVYDIEEILPQDWSKLYNFQVVDADGNAVMEFNYSVLSYAYVALGKSAEAQTGLNGLLKAMYLYYAAAAGISELDDAYFIQWSASDEAKEILTVEEDENLRQISYSFDTTNYDSNTSYRVWVENSFKASDIGSYARSWDISGTITKTNVSSSVQDFYLCFGVKSADGTSQYFGLYQNSVSLQNGGNPADTLQAHDGEHVWYNQATTSFFWDEQVGAESGHTGNSLDYHLVIENDVLTAYFGNSACACGGCSMQKAWQMPLTDSTYGGFTANSSYQMSVYAVHPRAFSISDIQVNVENVGLSLSELPVRDPFILEDDGTYYLYVTGYNGFFQTWSTTDFVVFQDRGSVFSAETGDTFRPIASSSFWAPEVYKYTNPDNNETAYYMFATLEREDCVRATAILKADSPTGPFAEFSTYDHGFVTPSGHSCLDGTLYIENGVPYMIYAHEYTCSACNDDMGDMAYVQLSNDLSHAVTEPVTLFTAKDLTNYNWFQSLLGNDNSKVTDGPFVYSKDGINYLLWSTFVDGDYVLAYTTFGNIAVGIDAKNNSVQLYTDNGGHGMIFTYDGMDRLILHAPNDDPRPVIFNVNISGTTMSITEFKTSLTIDDVMEKDSDGYYLITSADHLQYLVNSSASFRLAANIACNETITGFVGTLDGQAYTIETTASLFDSLENVTIKDLTINLTADLTGATGALAGSIRNSDVTNVTVTGSGSITGDSRLVGGLVGDAGGTTFTRCTNYIAVTNTNGNEYYCAGGIAGGTYEVQTEYACRFIDCVNYGTITAVNGSDSTAAGGIMGDARTANSVISGCKNYGTVTAQSAGGIAGISVAGNLAESGVQFTGCTNEAEAVVNGQYIGGILGYAKNPGWGSQYFAKVIISGCTNKGTVENTATSGECCVGGIVGRMIDNADSSITNSLNEGTVKGYQNTGAIIGYVSGGSYTMTGCSNTGDVYEGGVLKVELEKDSDGYYLITCEADMRALANSSDMFRLTKNITNSSTVSGFAGTLDGQGYTIETTAMLFGSLNGATIKNLNIQVNTTLSGSGVDVGSGRNAFGALAGMATGSSITDVTVSGTGSIEVNIQRYVGGLVGCGSGTAFSDCTNSIAVTNTNTSEYSNAGGILGGTLEVGAENACTFTNCTNNGTVTAANGSDNTAAGGIIGLAQTTNTVLSGCINNGTVTGQSAGGIVGLTIAGNNGGSGVQITNCTNNTGAVINGQYIGGILGYAKNPNWGDQYKSKVIISGCTNKGTVENTATSGECCVGGIAGRMTENVGSSITDSHNEGTVSGYMNAGAIIGYQDGTCSMTGCTNSGTVLVNGVEQTELMQDSEGYYLISKDADILALANSSDKFRLTANVTCSATISSFSGTLNGQGYTISTDTMLFGSLNNATVQNLTVNVTASLTASASNEGIGALAGSATGSSITDVTVSGSGSISASCKFVGGLVGRGRGTSFTRCTNSIAVTNTGMQEYYNAGGILGGTWEVNPEYGCSFTDCVNNGTIISNYDPTAGWNATTYVAGGIVGFVQSPNTSISGCTNNGTVKSQSSGGIVGVHIAGANGNSGLTITNCVNSSAAVIDGQYIGGILGFAKNPGWGDQYRAKVTITGCYNRGTVANTATSGECSIGGIVGRMHNNAGSVISNCHNEGTVSAYKEAGAIIGCKYEGSTTMEDNCTNTGTVTVNGTVVSDLISYNG